MSTSELAGHASPALNSRSVAAATSPRAMASARAHRRRLRRRSRATAPVDVIVAGVLVLPATPAVISGFVTEAEAAPDELSTIGTVMPAPPLPFLPEELHGRPVVMAKMVHAGGAEAGRRAIAPFRALAEPVADLLRSMHGLARNHDIGDPGRHFAAYGH